MGKKKRGHPDVEEVLARPWCYYCERDFDDLKILISHQKAKHFKCERCGRRLNTAGGLSVHMNQVHKEALTSVENALPNRQGLEVEIFGMEGIPEDVIQAHNQRVLQQFYEAEAERRATTGNPAPGGANNAAPKKPKFESPSDLKKRLAEHKAKKAAQEAAGVSSGDVTPMGAGQTPQSPGVIPSPGPYQQATSPPYMQHQPSFSNPQGSPPQLAFAQPYGQPPPFGQQPPFNPQQQPGFGPPMPQFGPPGAPQFPPPGQSFSPAGASPFQPPFQGAPPRQFGAGSPPFHQGPHQPPPHIPQAHGLPPPQRQGSLPAAPGLPQRPSFGAPQVNAFQLQQMHQGQGASLQNSPQNGGPHGQQSQGPHETGAPPSLHSANDRDAQSLALSGEHTPNIASSVDDLIASAVRDARPAPSEEPPATDANAEKKVKKEKEKDKNTRLVYSDNELSPEEKMAKLPRYAFVPDHKEETYLAEAGPAVTGVVLSQDDVLDKQD